MGGEDCKKHNDHAHCRHGDLTPVLLGGLAHDSASWWMDSWLVLYVCVERMGFLECVNAPRRLARSRLTPVLLGRLAHDSASWWRDSWWVLYVCVERIGFLECVNAPRRLARSRVTPVPPITHCLLLISYYPLLRHMRLGQFRSMAVYDVARAWYASHACLIRVV